MLSRSALLRDLQKLQGRLEEDLLARSDSADVPDVGIRLRAEQERARAAARTAQNFEDWRADAITQMAAAWVLSCVFTRFLEDNRLIDPPRISGPDERLVRARDEQEAYFREHARQTDRDYLLAVFDALARLPGAGDLFGAHNPIHELPNWLSGDAAGELLKFFQRIDTETGLLVYDFSEEKPGAVSSPAGCAVGWDTRFLGDLYQDLSEAARKKYALLQTPEFVEEFILDRTLDPALDEFGLVVTTNATGNQEPATGNFRMIDPACGSGHFLLGAFRRILDRWQRREPATNVRVLVQRALDSVNGVDVNPYAVAIARFRLLLAAMWACGVRRLTDAPAFRLNLACGDSLLHAPLIGGQAVLDFELTGGHDAECEHAYAAEDLPALKRMLQSGQYHAVVANPPYITPKDRQLNERYRRRYETCHMKYSLAVPFMERIFRLAVPGGFTGQITANSFMKREFGKKLIESFLPTIDLTHVIDTSGAYIPGHGTPTVILFGQHRAPVVSTIRTVMGIRGEPSTPDDPARGLVWTAIVEQIDRCGSESAFVSVADSPREMFGKHPWSIGGGGAAELKEDIEADGKSTLQSHIDSIGFASFTGQDEAFVAPMGALRRAKLPVPFTKQFVVGDTVRDWGAVPTDAAFSPYDASFEPVELAEAEPWSHWIWPMRAAIGAVVSFGGKTRIECGDKWWTWYRWIPEKYRTPFSIVFAFVATHNHFVLDRGGKVFNRSAPVIKLSPAAIEDEHLGLLGLLNSSTACFWMKQVFHDKGSTVDSKGARQTTVAFENFREFTATGLHRFPLPADRPTYLARFLDGVAQCRQGLLPAHVLTTGTPTVRAWGFARKAHELALTQLISAQEELDWSCYRLYGLIDQDLCFQPRHTEAAASTIPTGGLRPPLATIGLPHVALGQRAFEIVMARKMAASELSTSWFVRHGSTPITELPADWSDDYRALVERRIELIASSPSIALIEQPEYKRRWNTVPWDEQAQQALREWLLNRLESYFDFDGRMKDVVCAPQAVASGSDGESPAKKPSPSSTAEQAIAERATTEASPPPLAAIALVSLARLADMAAKDADFLRIGQLYRGDEGFDVSALVSDLVEAECVPFLPVLRYKPSGVRKRAEWETTWELQRLEDRLQAGEEGLDLDAWPLDERRRATITQWQAERLNSSPKTQDQDPKSQDPKSQDPSSKTQSLSSLLAIAVPPKYTSADFLKSSYWRLRGKLDVPKERWVSFPHCEGPDDTLMIGWAGYDHLQLARAVSAYYVDVQERLGGRGDPRLAPLLAALVELLPWLAQWHNEPDAAFEGLKMGDYFEGFINEEARQMGKTLAEIKGWAPENAGARRKARR